MTPHSQLEFSSEQGGGVATCAAAEAETTVAAPTVAPVAPPALPAVLRERPNAQWFVRAPQGGHYGPATNETLQQWIVDGRVGPRSLVWRDDWKDWLPASRVFSEQVGSGADRKSATNRSSKASRYLHDKQRHARPKVRTLVWLAVIGVVLAVIALAVLLPKP